MPKNIRRPGVVSRRFLMRPKRKAYAFAFIVDALRKSGKQPLASILSWSHVKGVLIFTACLHDVHHLEIVANSPFCVLGQEQETDLTRNAYY